MRAASRRPLVSNFAFSAEPLVAARIIAGTSEGQAIRNGEVQNHPRLRGKEGLWRDVMSYLKRNAPELAHPGVCKTFRSTDNSVYAKTNFDFQVSQAPLKCGAPDCTNAIEQKAKGRAKRFCSARCRKAASRCHEIPGRPNGHQANLNTPTAFQSISGQKKTKDFNARKTAVARGVVSPRSVIQAEIIDSRDWTKVISSSGVVSYVSRVPKPALRNSSAT